MGRYLLFIVAAVALAGSVLSLSALGSESASSARRAESQEATVAREAAASGYAITSAQVARGFEARTPVQAVQLDGGRFGAYDATVAASGRGPLDLLVTGRFAGAGHRITGQAMPLAALGGALVVAAERASFQTDGSSFEIRGADVRQPSAVSAAAPRRPGVGRSGRAVLASSPRVASSFLGALTEATSPLLSGILSAADVGTGPLPPVVAAMYAQALATGTRVAGPAVYRDRTFGAPGSPAVLVVSGDVELSGATRGHGLLVVQGDVTMTDDARWEGVVLVQADADERLRVTLESDAGIVGSLVLIGIEDRFDEGDAGLPGGHFDVDVFTRGSAGMRRSYHKHQYDDSYDVTHVDLIAGPGVASYWNAFRTTYAGRPLRAELFNTHNGSGTLTLESPAGAFSVPNCAAFSTVIVPDQVTAFRTAFVDLQQLRGTSPGSVRDDAATRIGAYSIRLYDGATLVYEVSAYEHAEDRDGYGCGTTAGPGGTSGQAPGTEVGEYGRFEVRMTDRASLLYSEEAVGQVGFALSDVRAHWRVGRLLMGSETF